MREAMTRPTSLMAPPPPPPPQRPPKVQSKDANGGKVQQTISKQGEKGEKGEKAEKAEKAETVARTADGEPICFTHNNRKGCKDASEGERCSRGWHAC